jgi:hypothetical protein
MPCGFGSRIGSCGYRFGDSGGQRRGNLIPVFIGSINTCLFWPDSCGWNRGLGDCDLGSFMLIARNG